MHVVVFRLRGQVAEGVQVTLEWRPEQSFQTQGTLLGTLTPNTDITALYTDWRRHYCNLGEATRLEFDAPSEQRLDLRRNKQLAKQQCDAAAHQLEANFKQWLNNASDFQRITRQLSELYGSSEGIRFLFRTDDPELQRLPWHLWGEMQRHPTPIALGSLEYQQGQVSPLGSPVRVLAIFGCDRNINLAPDLDTLNKIPNIELTTLQQPQRHEIAQALRQEKGWDIVFFAGHSRTEGQQGILSINENDSFTSKELHQHLKIAATKGLKICIFNSCDGLGLARHLANLKIPYVIYMREPVPDQVAHRFFQSLIQHFSVKDSTLHNAVLAAQHDLEAIQDRFPYATWLPTLFQQPHADTLCWPQPRAKRRLMLLGLPITALTLIGIIVGTLTIVNNNRNPTANLFRIQGDSISFYEEVLGSRPVPKKKAVSFLAKRKYQLGIEKLLESWQEDGKDPETLIYLNNAVIDANQIKHYTIAVVVPFSKDNNDLAYRLLKGVAQAQTEANLKVGKLSSLVAPSFLAANEIGPNIGLKVIIANDKNDIEEAKTRAATLAKNPEIIGVVGHYASDMSQPTIPIYKEYGLPMISPGSSATELSEEGEGYFFRTVPITKDEATLVANYLIETKKQKVMVYYNRESPFTHSFWKDFKSIYDPQGRKIIRQVMEHDPLSDITSPNFEPNRVISALKSLDPKETALLLVPDGEVTNSQKNAFKLIEANAGQYAIVGSWGIDHPKTLEVLKKYPSSSLVVPVPWHHLASPNRDFPKQTQQLWNQTVRGQTALAYDATRAFIHALSLQTSPSRQGTRDALANSSFKVQGATGTVAFEKNGDRKSPPQVLIKAMRCSSGIEFLPLGKTCIAQAPQ